MTRPTRARLDAAALRHNVAQVRARAPRARLMAVVKADGYGHGLEWVARQLPMVDGFGVACVEEGIRLRHAGVTQPIALLEGFFSADELTAVAEHRLEPVLHCVEQVRILESCQLPVELSVWLKADTGMHRLGFDAAEWRDVYRRVRACRGVARVRFLSHLASADDPADPTTSQQLAAFESLTGEYAGERSLANSAAIVAWPACQFDWVRPGIMLYGVSPLIPPSAGTALNLKPVMTLETALIAIHRRKRGDAIGYGGAWHCPQDMTIGVAAIGYGDGYPRHAAAGTPVWVNGRRAPLVGRVSMDMITLDLRQHPAARVGDRVVLWGGELPVEEVAAHAGTIAYELLCRVTPRVPRVTD